MTEKQKAIVYYRSLGYSTRHCALIAGVSDSYAARVLNNVEEVSLENYIPPLQCIKNRQTLDSIIASAGYAFIPNFQKYSYVSLLAYLGFNYADIKKWYPQDKTAFLYMAVYRSGKAWKDFDSSYIGVEQQQYNNLLKIR